MALAVVGALVPAATLAATPLSAVRVSPDVTVTLGGVTVDDESVARDDLLGGVTLQGIAPVPQSVDLDAYHLLPNGDQLLSFDTTVTLPGGPTVRPADVVRLHAGNYTVEFDASARGVPAGANVDAVAVRGPALVLSFDVAVSLGGVFIEDEDLVLFDGVSFTLFFDGSASGLDPRLDLDAADLLECNDHLLVSFDGSGSLGGVPFDDEDILETDRISSWEIVYDGDARDPSWRAADLDALHGTVNLGPGPPIVFGQTVLADPSKVAFRWTTSVPFRAVRGAFASPGDIGQYAINFAKSGTGNVLPDATVPGTGTGLWYLVKPGGCTATSWQSTLGAEPGRDAAIP